jgi:hypothetical protein
MTITNGYTTLAQFKEYLTPEAGTDTGDDALMEALIEMASRAIERHTGRVFYDTTC